MPILNNLTVNEIGGGPAPAGLYREFQLEGGLLVPSKTTTHIMDFTGVTEIYDCLFYQAYAYNTAISGTVDMSDLTAISGFWACSAMFVGCTGLTGFDLSALTTIGGDAACEGMFAECTGLTSADLPALDNVGGARAAGYMFQDCTGLTSANLSALTMIYDGACAGMFAGCTSLATVYIGGTMAIDFGGTEPFPDIFSNCTQDIDVYAPAGNQAEIEAMTGYPNFGGTGTVTWHWRS